MPDAIKNQTNFLPTFVTPTLVHPFILRGITLAGIDSAQCPRASRLEIWRRLATDWHLSGLEAWTREITLAEVPKQAERMLAGKTFGRTLVRPIE